MALAARLQRYLDSRAAGSATREAARLSRDAFIKTQFPVLNTRLVELVTEAVGEHSRLAIATTSMVESVIGRSFATLNKTAIRITAMPGSTPQTITLTPRLDFRAVDQFGAVDCAIDFDYAPRRARADMVAASLLAHGIQVRGRASAHLMLETPEGLIEASTGLLESAFGALLLRG